MREHRTRLKITQRTVAQRVNVALVSDDWAPATVAKVELGQRGISLDELYGLGAALGVPWQDLLTGTRLRRTPPSPERLDSNYASAVRAVGRYAQARSDEYDAIVARRLDVSPERLRDLVAEAFPGAALVDIRDELVEERMSETYGASTPAADDDGFSKWFAKTRGHATRRVLAQLREHLDDRNDR